MTSPLPFLTRIWTTYVTDVQADTNAESQAFLQNPPNGRTDRDMIVVLITIILCHIFIRFFGSSNNIRVWQDLFHLLQMDEVAEQLHAWLNTGPNYKFHKRIFWATARVTGYIIVPMIIIRTVLKDRVRNYGTDFRGLFKHAPIYGVMFIGIVPFVIGASYFPAFQAKYPYYKLASGESLWPYFIGWEILYALQFVGVEFFYRGFMLHGLKRRLGYASVFVMMVPYMMIHYGKPLGECAGSVIAGFVLGTLSLKSRSIWWGGSASHCGGLDDGFSVPLAPRQAVSVQRPRPARSTELTSKLTPPRPTVPRFRF